MPSEKYRKALWRAKCIDVEIHSFFQEKTYWKSLSLAERTVQQRRQMSKNFLRVVNQEIEVGLMWAQCNEKRGEL